MTDLDLDTIEAVAAGHKGCNVSNACDLWPIGGVEGLLALVALARRAGDLERALFLTQEALIAAHLPTPDMRHVRCTLCDLLPSPAEMYAIDAATAQPEVRG